MAGRQQGMKRVSFFLWIPSNVAWYHLKEYNLSLEEIYRVIQPNLHLQAGLFLTLDQTPVFHGLLESLERLPHLRLIFLRKCLLHLISIPPASLEYSLFWFYFP